MKLTKFIATALLLVVASSSVFAAKKAKDTKVKIEIEDRQGFALGADIPDWVMMVANGEKSKVAKALKLEGEKQVFVFQQQGPDLDFLKVWTDNVDVRAEVTNSFSQAVGQTANATYKAGQGDETKKQRAIDMATKALSTMEVNGLLKEAQYWFYFKRPKPDVKKAKKPADWDYYYEYYVVFAMDKALYDAQLDAALNGIEDNASETVLLKKALSANLRAPLLPAVSEDSEIAFDE